MTEQVLTRLHLKGFGLSDYQTKVISKPCQIRGKAGSCNLYYLSDILESAREYIQKPRIQKKTKTAIEKLISQLVQSIDNVVVIPFGINVNEIAGTVKTLITTKSSTDQFKLRATALKGKLKNVGIS